MAHEILLKKIYGYGLGPINKSPLINVPDNFELDVRVTPLRNSRGI